MAKNPYFNHENHTPSQELMADLNAEVIIAFGIDVWYLPRKSTDIDWLFGDDNQKLFSTARKMEMLVSPETIDSWGGDREFLSNKFGMEIRDEVKLQVSQARWKEEMESWDSDLWKPRVGDIISSIYNPDSFWKISFVNDEMSNDFHQMGKLYNWEISCELLIYNQENITTDIPGHEKLAEDFNVDEYDDVSNIPEYADNDNFEEAKDDVMDFDESNPFGNF